MSNSCCSINRDTSERSMKRKHGNSSDGSTTTTPSRIRPAFEFLPDFLRFYCCICCRYGHKKSIDTISLQVDKQQQHDFSENLKQQKDNNNFYYNYMKRTPTKTATTTPIVQLNINTNKTPMTLDQAPSQSSSPESQNGIKTPVSGKSSYSQKSTASARSGGTGYSDRNFMDKEIQETINADSLPINKLPSNDERIDNGGEIDGMGEYIIDEISKEIEEDGRKKRSTSISSLQSKTESIKTQLEDTPPTISRAQSLKSIVIDEDLDGTDSFLVVEDIVEEQLTALKLESHKAGGDRSSPVADKNGDDDYNENEFEIEEKDAEDMRNVFMSNTASGQHSPTLDEIKPYSRRNSLAKSMDALYESRPRSSKMHDPFDTATETSSQSSNQARKTVSSTNIIANIKPQHTPLKQKAKTSSFLRNHRKVSPVKQSIQMQKVELYPSTLGRFDKPREALLHTFEQLDSSNWEVNMEGLKSMVRLMRYHSDYLETQMHMVCIQLTRSVRNLRSQVSRAACQAATEIFQLKSKTLEQECDDLVCALLLRTSDTNRFLRADATGALETMVNNLSPAKILNILTSKGAHHNNALVRTTSAKLLHSLVVRIGFEKVYAMPRENRDKFFVTGANLLLEGRLDTRSHAKSMFRLLSNHPSYNRLILEVIPQRIYRNVEKTLKNLR